MMTIGLIVVAGWLTPAAPAGTSIRTADNELLFSLQNKEVARYRHAGTVQLEKGTGSKPLAKPFLWPLNTPKGVSVTRDWPLLRGTAGETTDHFHQKSAWFCHGDVIPEGITLTKKSADKRVEGVDFWSEAGNHGRIACTGIGPIADGVSVRTTNRWDTADEQPILDEVRTLSIVPQTTGYRIDFTITLTAAYCPITFGDTKEGCFGVRVPDRFPLKSSDQSTVTSSTGAIVSGKANDNLKIWGLAADWNDYSHRDGESVAGIAIFDHPKNPHRAHWHTRAYGLMAANPFARSGSGFPGRKADKELVRLAKGASLTLRYAIFVHDGDAASVTAAYAEFIK
ncbi:MAG: PmoA family protein [Gemmataceae bacterium]